MIYLESVYKQNTISSLDAIILRINIMKKNNVEDQVTIIVFLSSSSLSSNGIL